MRPRRITSWKATGARRRRARSSPRSRRGAGARARAGASLGPAASNTRSAPSRLWAATTWSAPNAAAASRRSAWGSTTPTPRRRSAACSVTRPIVPAPITTARSAGPPSTPAPDPRGVDAVGQRLGEHAEPGVGAVGQLPQPVRRDAHELGEAAGAVHADQLAVRGELLDAGQRVGRVDERVDGRAAVVPTPASTPSPSATTRPGSSWPITSGGVPVGLLAAVALDLRAAHPDGLGPRAAPHRAPGSGSGSSSTDMLPGRARPARACRGPTRRRRIGCRR